MEEDTATSTTLNDNTLTVISAAQKSSTDSFFKKFFHFVKYHFTENPFEAFVYANEANDCSLVAKFQKTVDLELPSSSGISIPSLSLNGVHIPHPLETYIEKNHSAKDAEVRKDLQDTPIVLFIHGLGGQISQFEPLMGLFSQCSEIWAIDLPGFGNSRASFPNSAKYKSITEISPEDKKRISSTVSSMDWSDFETDSIVAILYEFVRQYIPAHKKLVVVGHSMGTHLSIKLIRKLDKGKVEALVLLSPPSLQDDLPNPEDTESDTIAPKKVSHSTTTNLLKVFTYVPWLFNSFRIWDRLEGLESKSVLRQLVPQTNVFTRLRQLRWNLDIDSSIVLRYAYGFRKAKYSDLITAFSKFNNDLSNQKTYTKILIVGGASDKVTPHKTIYDIEKVLNTQFNKKVSQAIEIKDVGHSILLSKPEFTSGTIINFVETNCPERLHLSPAWVLRVKADISGDKWGLKNEMKWMALQPISANITKNDGKDVAPLLGMKTLREGDASHSPKILESMFYGEERAANSIKGQLIAVVDISHDIPPYSPTSFETVKYYKCATVSKVVPDSGAIRRFIRLIDDILSTNSSVEEPLIVVHCHYGFNRTGFLICCYLVERLGWTVQEAVEGYKTAKPPGIKHPHFVDALYVRYER